MLDRDATSSGAVAVTPGVLNGRPPAYISGVMRIDARLLSVAALASFAAPAPIHGQVADSPSLPTVASCDGKRPLLATVETLGVNVVLNRANAWLFGWEFGHVGPDSWGENLSRGFKWDGTQWGVNMFAHPYHGGLYFTTGRANCLNFWESIPLAFLGSWTWEYFGETHRASLNDFYTTGLGGPAVGEILHRVSWTVLDEEARGLERIGRELVATIINPVGGLNRLARGQWMRRGVNPVDRVPEWHLFELKMGGRRVEELGKPSGPQSSPTFLADIELGDVFETEYRAPYDVLEMRAQLNPDGGLLNLLRTVGRLYGTELTTPEDRHRHAFLINQRFVYINNPVYNFGEHTVEAAIESRWRPGPEGTWITTRVGADVVMLGAVEALESGLGQRTVDWGPGLGAMTEVALAYHGTTVLSAYSHVRLLQSVSGVPAQHTFLFTGAELTIPITRWIGLGAYVSADRRWSDYQSFPDSDRTYHEARVYLTWTPARGVPGFPR